MKTAVTSVICHRLRHYLQLYQAERGVNDILPPTPTDTGYQSIVHYAPISYNQLPIPQPKTGISEYF